MSAEHGAPTARVRRRWLTRRRALAGCFVAPVLLVLGVWLATPWLLSRFAGASRHAPEELERGLSPASRALLERAWSGVDPALRLDVHVHVAGIGTDGSGCRVEPAMMSWLHPWKRAQFLVYAHAARIEDLEHGDEQFFARLCSLARADPHHGRYVLLAFDRRHREDGSADDEGSPMVVPDDYVATLAAREPELFLPALSVHPYRADAIAELERCAARGARLCKWLPNAMGIDPADARCDAFYDALARSKVVLLSHSGDEHAVDAGAGQDYGNPLRLRRALEHGVTVIAAHCASLGEGVDLDAASPGSAPRVENFELFLRLMGEERWKGRLFGEISAMTLRNRPPGVLAELLARPDICARLVDGSDYPLPAIRVVWSTQRFVDAGMLDESEARALEEIYDYNPLAFDFALKRTLRHPVSGARFPARVFEGRATLGW